MTRLNIAVVGSGISGLAAAWLLAKRHDVTLIEADERLGGHTNTARIPVADSAGARDIAVDTGFICFNHITYPNLTALFEHLRIPVHETRMSFSASLAGGAYEYSGGTYLGLLAQPSNAFRGDHWRMIADILRFFREAPAELEALDETTTIARYLRYNRYSRPFIDRHLLPIAAAIWSGTPESMLDYPARSFIRFFHNHGLLQVDGRPKWGTVDGGANRYIDAMLSDSQFHVQTGTPVKKIVRRPDGVVLHFGNNLARVFDQVVVATHADQALNMLEAPSGQERALLGAFRYSQNHAVLHKDPTLMPKRRLAWASWNYLDFRSGLNAPLNDDLCLTYWMNSLQNLPTREQIFVTLNPPRNREIRDVAGEYDYAHPIFDGNALAAQRDLWSLQGVNRTWFCGAHFGAGFHEDGLQAGLAVAEQLGGQRRPWSVENESGRIVLLDETRRLQAAE